MISTSTRKARMPAATRNAASASARVTPERDCVAPLAPGDEVSATSVTRVGLGGSCATEASRRAVLWPWGEGWRDTAVGVVAHRHRAVLRVEDVRIFLRPLAKLVTTSVVRL